MNTASLIKKNMKWNFKNYFLYFASMIFIIMIVYTFNSIQYNKQILENVNESMIFLMQIGAIFIYIFAFIFMWYSNNFFTRNRKKEVGLYSMLGVEKKKIARMLFIENLSLGLVGLIIGIIGGTLLSRIFVMLLFHLMGKFIAVKFAFSISAIINTATIFSVFFAVLSIHSYILIYRFKLIEFFRAKNKREKEPKGSLIVAIISILMLVSGYFIAVCKVSDMNFMIYALSVLTLIVIGTYGLFVSFMVFYGKIKRKNTKKLYKGMNLINTSNFIYRIRGNAFILGSIAILSATAITAAGMSTSLYYTIGADVELDNPYSYSYIIEDDGIDSKVNEIMEKYPEHNIIFDDIIEVKNSVVDIEKTDGNIDMDVALISESEFKKISTYNKLDNIDIKKDRGTIFIKKIYSEYTNYNSVKIKDIEKPILQNKIIKKDIVVSSFGFMTVLLDDASYKKIDSTENPIQKIRLIEVENKKNSEELTNELKNLFKEERGNDYLTRLTAFNEDYKTQMEFRGMFMFVGSFIALVVLVCTGSMIYFKLINEAEDEKKRYEIVRKVGANRKDIFKSIANQMAAMFIFPIILGITHASFALGALSQLLKADLIKPTIFTMIVYVIIYFIYYLLTVNKYNKTVNS